MKRDIGKIWLTDSMKKGHSTGEEILYWYGTPAWLARLLMLIFLMFSMFTGYLAINFDLLSSGSQTWVKYVLYILSCGFLLPLLRRGNWQSIPAFYLTKAGLVIPDLYPITPHTVWLTIPWGRINAITHEGFAPNMDGPIFWLTLTPQEVESHFKNDSIAKRLFGRPVDLNNYPVKFRRLIFMPKPKVVVEQLNRIKSFYG